MIQPVWREPTYVLFSDTDFRARWKVARCFAAMVEAAGHHAEHLGFGYQEMLAHDKIWILSRMKIRFSRFPQNGEQIIIETWPRGVGQKVFFIRDYHILNSREERLASATSAYLLVSPSTRRMQPPHSLYGDLPLNDGRTALDEALEKLPAAAPLEPCGTRSAGYSDIDLVGHVNNTRYIDWVMDSFPLDFHQQHELRWLQINYVNEVKPGETIQLQRAAYARAPGSWYVGGTNTTSGLPAFDAALGWEPVSS